MRKTGRNSRWRNFDGFDIISMPDKWEYPWFAAWDLAFHTVTLAHLDPAFAKYQLILICREWFQHPQGALPAYEWDFGDVNPPVHAWAALQVFAIDGGRDLDFLCRVFDKLLVNFTWWVNREDASDKNVFEGGFLGLDNIGPIDRSHLPAGYTLEQSDATGWMGFYALALGAIAAALTWSGNRKAQDLVLKFLEHFAAIRTALDEQGLWDDADGLFYDRLITPSGYSVPVKYRSMVGIIPALAAAVIDDGMLHQRDDHEQELRAFPGPGGPRGLQKLASTRSCAARPAPSGCWSRWPGPPSWSGCSPSCSTRASSCPRTGCARCRPTTATIPTSSTSRATSPPSTMSRPSRPLDVRRQLQLARPDLDAGQLPGDRIAGALPPVLRRRPGDRVPDRVGQAAHPGPDRRRPAGPAHLPVHQGRQTGGGPASAGPRRCRPTRPGRTT